MSTRHTRLFTILALAFVSTPATAALVPLSSSGANAAAITPTVNAFRTAIGDPNNANNAGPLTSGRREINWDGGGATTTSSPTPFNGFQNIRGALFTTPGTGFLQAPPAGLDTFFGRADNLYNNIFEPFSAQRVFTPNGSTITDVTFFIPGSNGGVPAFVTAFGAIFLDVDSPVSSSLQFFDVFNNPLGTFSVPAVSGSETFSFVGVQATGAERIGRVRITSGNTVLSGSALGEDQVALDDFIFAEPRAVPEPAPLALLGIAVAALGFSRRKLQ